MTLHNRGDMTAYAESFAREEIHLQQARANGVEMGAFDPSPAVGALLQAGRADRLDAVRATRRLVGGGARARPEARRVGHVAFVGAAVAVVVDAIAGGVAGRRRARGARDLGPGHAPRRLVGRGAGAGPDPAACSGPASWPRPA